MPAAPAGDAPQFDVLVEGSGPARAGLLAALRDDLDDALERVVAARAEEGAGGAPSPFWRTATALDDALAGTDRSTARRALDDHVTQLSLVLGGTADVRPRGGGFQLHASAAGMAAGEVLSSLVTWSLPGPVGVGAAALLVAAGAYRPVLAAAPRGRARRRRLAAALGEVLVLGEDRW